MHTPKMSYENEFERVLDDLTVTKNYHSTLTLLRSDEYKSRVKKRCSDAIQACAKYLNDENYEKDLDMYCCCEEFLKYVATVGYPAEVLLELLEIIEVNRSDNVFTTALKALQICLRNQKKNRINGWEWSLNSIHTFMLGMEVPEIIREGYDEKQEKLLEQMRQVHRILLNFTTITLFLEPLIKEVLSEPHPPSRIFKDVTRSRRNLLACFALQLLGRPMALLNLADYGKPVGNADTLHCARFYCTTVCTLLGDPFFLLPYVENKVRWKRRRPRDDGGVYENAPRDIFMLEEKTPLVSLGVFYYLLLVSNMLPKTTPKVYHPLHIFHMTLYLVEHLLRCDEPALQFKGICLGSRAMQNLHAFRISCNSLDLQIHQDFCSAVSKVIVFSTIERNRKSALQLLTTYVFRFDDSGQYRLLQNLIRITAHNGLLGYLIWMYQNRIAKSLDLDKLPEHFQLAEFKHFLLHDVCKLPRQVETDLIEHSEQVLATLNLIRFVALADKTNHTGFWDFVDGVRKQFLQPLRTAIDLSRAHFKLELDRVTASPDDAVLTFPANVEIMMKQAEKLPEITKDQKLTMLKRAMLTFDLMESLMARTNECLETVNEKKT